MEDSGWTRHKRRANFKTRDINSTNLFSQTCAILLFNPIFTRVVHTMDHTHPHLYKLYFVSRYLIFVLRFSVTLPFSPEHLDLYLYPGPVPVPFPRISYSTRGPRSPTSKFLLQPCPFIRLFHPRKEPRRSKTLPSMSTNTSFQLLNLPSELRTHILSYLLPDLPVIGCDIGWSPTADGPPRNFPVSIWTPGVAKSAYQFRSDDEKCQTAVMRACRLLYHDSVDYLYRLKTFKIDVFDYGIDFLTHARHLLTLPLVPFDEMKEFVIQIVGCDMAETGYRLRENLVWLCGLLSHRKVHLKKLKIEFSSYSDNWLGKAWDETESEDPKPPTINESVNNECNAELAAWENGFFSTFAYIISPLALLPIADECTIEVPERLGTKKHILDLARWYQEGIDGTYAFEDNWRLKQDRADFEYKLKHPNGSRNRKCNCADCVEHYKELDGKAEESRKWKENIKKKWGSEEDRLYYYY